MINAFKTLLNGMMEYVKNMKSDWNENDPSSPHYVKNRTHWKEPAVITVIPEQEAFFNDSLGVYYFITAEEPLIEEERAYNVTFDGVQYECELVCSDQLYCIGNMSFLNYDDVEYPDTGEPFLILFPDGILATTLDGSHTISCTTDNFVYHKLSTKYLEKGKIIDGIFWHKSNVMTLEEAKTYEKIFSFLNTGLILRWSDYIISKIQVSNSTLWFCCSDDTMNYKIPINEYNVFSLSDACTSSIDIGKEVKYGIRIHKDRPVTVSPKAVSSGSATEDTVFKVENDGLKDRMSFEVLGNGTVKAYSVILPSTTADSTKKFRITVDDTGTLSATEVTS